GETAARDAAMRAEIGFAEARAAPETNLYNAVGERLRADLAAGQRVLVCGHSDGSRDRLVSLLADHGDLPLAVTPTWSAVENLPAGTIAAATLPIDHGFNGAGLMVVTEQDILGERLSRPRRRRRKGEEFLREVSSLEDGDHVVHIEHGIGRYDGLQTLEIGGAPHDCLRLVYHGGDKLFLPVENIEVLSRFGSEDAGVVLDKLGGAAWQARKARVKKRIRDMAEQLIRIAAEREIETLARVYPPEGVYEEFCARFPYEETEDQLQSITDVFEDLSTGRPMDRLICGDVGFGKTEVALRAALIVAMQGMQVAVVVPTTLLARQHFNQFKDRFRNLPLKVRQLSRMVTGKEASEVRAALASGACDVVVGTHALLAKTISFSNLGLLVIDEEQHFGVGQKERLKELKTGVHVLTLTATPIPRTLQMALTGVRSMSLIATPPVDRLAVRTFVMPYDGVVLREALMREHFRGGQSFYVCPRIEDLTRVHERLRILVPELKLSVAHGQMPARELEDVMTQFSDGGFDVLLSTHIVESGLDIPSANTIVIHRADMFGLAQLYQLRGRVGRSKTRAYAYLTTQPGKKLTPAAQRRLEVMQTLDSLGAGFSLASHDMDIRGTGNLLGEEQSGHVKEVGVELYQHLLREAVMAAREGRLSDNGQVTEDWTPQIQLGTPVLIPEAYVPDLSLRLGLYRRVAQLDDGQQIDAFAAELTDRFGPIPPEVTNLLDIIAIKQACKAANVAKVDAGPKGAVVAFRDNHFADPASLVAYIAKQAGTIQMRPDHRLVYRRNWGKPEQRVKGLTRFVGELAALAAGA
ncbi:MAG: transcription-repair coupling factor, partial [Pseudomonadota bacterium]|nr:transcription-repair coupling factor [Pseudomonadota bacterium]